MDTNNRFLTSPNLPSGAVSHVILDYRTNIAIRNALQALDIHIINTNVCNYLLKAENGHSDMQICHLGGDLFITDRRLHAYYSQNIDNSRVECSESLLSMNYPNCVLFNGAFVSDKLICNTNTLDRAILDFAERQGYRIIHINQGYSKCSICIVNDNSIITSDSGVYKTLERNNFNALLIENSGIILGDKLDGFIGGASGLIAKNKLAFTGDITLHKNSNAIIDFLDSFNITIICLSNDIMCDIGGIMSIKEIL